MPPFQVNPLTDDVSPLDNNLDLNRQKRRKKKRNAGYTNHSSHNLDNNESPSTDAQQSQNPRTTNRRSPCCRRVHFNDANEIYPTICLDDLTYCEHYSVWYSPQEHLALKFKRDKILSRMESGKPCKVDHRKDMTYRGLESMTQEGSYKVHRKTSQVIGAVMKEQERQRRRGYLDPQELASTSMALTTASKQKAWDMGRKDEEESQKLYDANNATLLESNPSRQSRKSWWTFNIAMKK